MGEASDRVKDGASDVNRVAGEIDGLRSELGSLVAELDRRRQALLDVRTLARRHPVAVAVAAGVVALALGGLVALVARNQRRQRRPSVRLREARRALARLLDHPDRVAAEPPLANKVLAAIVTTAGTLAAKRLVDRWMGAAAQQPRRPRTSAATIVRH